MSDLEQKCCATCSETKPLSAFYLVGKQGTERRPTCKDCMREAGRTRWAVKYPLQPIRPLEDYPEIEPDFGHWLAGFVDGEGSFGISAPNTSFICTFHLSLRKDDEPILRQCLERVDAGYILDAKRKAKRSPNEKPCARWDVGGKVPCLRIVEIFDRYPLRAKKARDFAIWREAVIEWNRIGTGTGRAGQPIDWSRMAELRRQLIDGRKYREPQESHDHPTQTDYGARTRPLPGRSSLSAV